MTRGKDKIDFDQTCSESFFSIRGAINKIPFPRKLELELCHFPENWYQINFPSKTDISRVPVLGNSLFVCLGSYEWAQEIHDIRFELKSWIRIRT